MFLKELQVFPGEKMTIGKILTKLVQLRLSPDFESYSVLAILVGWLRAQRPELGVPAN